MQFPRVFIILCVLGVLVILGSGLASPMLPLFAKDLGASTVEVGVINASYFGARIFVELPVGLISDRVGRRRLIILGIFLSALSAVVCGMAPTISLLIVGRVLWGIGGALYFGSSTVLVLDLFREGRGRALGIFQGIEFAGRLIGSPIGGALAEYWGFRVAFLATGGTLLVGGALALLSRDFRNIPSERAMQRPPRQPSIGASLTLLATGSILVASIIGFYRTFNMQGITQTLVPLMQSEQLSFSPLLIGVLGTFRTVGVVVMTFSSGVLTEKISYPPILLAGVGLTMLGNEGYIWLASVEGQTLASLCAGFGAGMIVVTLPLLVSESVDESVRGTAMGLYRTIFNIGSFTGPIVATAASAWLGIPLTFHVFTGLLLTAMPIVFTLKHASSGSADVHTDT
jgi:MFS family permease